MNLYYQECFLLVECNLLVNIGLEELTFFGEACLGLGIRDLCILGRSTLLLWGCNWRELRRILCAGFFRDCGLVLILL
jgi:hypothetical protein